MTKISIIVPVYNEEKNLKSCLESLINQTLDDIEIIVIDDASTDNSSNIIREYANKYSKIRPYFNKENLGQSETRNKGIELSSGEYITFVDSDDYVSQKMYETMYNAGKLNNYPDIISTGIRIVKDDEFINVNYDNDLKGRLYDINKTPNIILDEGPQVWNKLFKSKLIKNYKFINTKLYEDMAFTYSSLIKANTLLRMNNIDYSYRRDITNGVSAKAYQPNLHILDCLPVALEIEKEAKKCGKYENFKEQIKFLQMTVCLQRISEIDKWNIPNKEQIKQNLYKLILKNIGDLDSVDTNLLTSRVLQDDIEEFKNYNSSKFKQNRV